MNSVLGGYFARLVILLVGRKQNQFIPYLYNGDALEMLLEHLEQHSISEVLNKLLQVEESNFDPDFAVLIRQRKAVIVTKLIAKLASTNTPSCNDENINASLVI